MSLKIGQVRSKTSSLGQILGKHYVCSRGHNFSLIIMKFGKNICLEQILDMLCTYPVIPSFVHVCIYFEWFPLWLFLELDSYGFSFVEYCSGSFRAILQSDY